MARAHGNRKCAGPFATMHAIAPRSKIGHEAVAPHHPEEHPRLASKALINRALRKHA